MYKNKIRKYRKNTGMTIEELASKVGISAGYLCHLEKGSRQNPSTKIMGDISRELKKTVAEIFFIE